MNIGILKIHSLQGFYTQEKDYLIIHLKILKLIKFFHIYINALLIMYLI